MTEPNPLLEWLGVSGVISGIGAAIGYGRLNEKVEAHAKELAEFRDMAKNAVSNNNLLVRLDERMAGLKEELAEIKAALKDKKG
jgi:hypothetical protein